jgi:endogenous inhibitor of DNA gyrase (YacG/DUF329 family)
MLDPTRSNARHRKKPKCPICSRPAAEAHKPFCSDRCRKVDLHRWLGEGYRIETDEAPGSDDPARGERSED